MKKIVNLKKKILFRAKKIRALKKTRRNDETKSSIVQF